MKHLLKKIICLILLCVGIASTAVCQIHAPSLPPNSHDGMTNIGRVVLPPNVPAQYSAAFDPTTGFGYFGATSGLDPTIVSKVNLNGPLPTVVQDEQPKSIPKGVSNLLTLVIDTSDPNPLKHYIYAGAASGQIIKMSPGDATHTPQFISMIEPKSATGTILCSVIDITSPDPKQHYVYYGIAGLAGKIPVVKALRVRLWDFTEQGAEALNMRSVRSAAIDNIHHFAYFSGILPQLAKVNLTMFRDGGSAVTYTMDSKVPGDGIAREGLGFPTFDEGLVIDETHGYVYIGTYNINAEKRDRWPNNQVMVVRVKLGSGDAFPAHPLEVLNLRVGERDLSAAVFDATHGNVYFGTDNTYPAHVYMIHVGDGTKPMEEVGRLDLNLGSLTEYPKDGEIAQGGEVERYGEFDIRSAILDVAHEVIYFGTDSRPGQVIKVGINGKR